MIATWAMGKALSEQSCRAVHGRHLEQVRPAKLVLALFVSFRGAAAGNGHDRSSVFQGQILWRGSQAGRRLVGRRYAAFQAISPG